MPEDAAPQITKQRARLIMQAFSEGRATKEQAIHALGVRDYAELLVWLGDAGIQPPRLPDAEIEEQVDTFTRLWQP